MTDLSNSAVRGYTLKECVGRGGSGAVYRAYQAGVEREVAVKVILPEYANQPEFIRRFEVEARLIAQLEHPHIVPLYDFWREPDGAYLVMRWLPRSLRSAVNGRYWSVESAIKLLDQIGSALIAAHRKGIIHRDIKPDNILLDAEGNAYLADFGIAKNLNATHNTSGNFRGTPAYVAPEQIKGETLDQRTDIYLLGLVLYELLVGEKPYGDDASPATLLIKHLTDPLPQLSTRRSDLPRSLNTVIEKATQKNPAERYADVNQLLAALHQVIEPVSVPVIPGTEELTIRERDIIGLLAQGLGIPEIAERLVMSPSTVKWYLKQIYDKLGLHSRPQAIDRAKQLVRQWSGSSASANPPAEGKLRANATERSLVEPLTSYAQIAVENPYKGLRPFLEADSAHFFGRTKLIERLLTRLSERGTDNTVTAAPPRFLAVVGPSGSGKSSVVQAGLLPRLRSGGLQGAEKWFITSMYPGAYPLEELESVLLSVAVNPPSDLMAQLRQDSRGLLRAVKRILPRDEATELLLVIDQFEELFTLVENEAERAHFLDSLRLALSDPRSRLRVIVTLRADFLDKPLQYVDFGELLRQRIEFVLPLSPDELRQAIVGPAEATGLRVESALMTTVVADVSEQPGALPLLQFALMELFERREGRKLTLNAYRASGGVAGALARRADELYDSLNEEGQEAARQLFLRLITLGEVDNTRRRVTRSELATLVEQPGFLDAVIEAYNQYRLLTLDRDPATRMPTVEVAHEAVIRSWERLRGWIEEAHDDLRAQRQLAQAAAEWEASHRDPSFLATGTRLGRFESMVASGIIALNEEERRYFEASVVHRSVIIAAEEAQREHEAELTQQAIESKEIAEENLRQSERIRLASEALVLLDSNISTPEIPALLALRSLSMGYTPDADLALLRAMYRGFVAIPELGVLRITDGSYFSSVAFSPDGTLLAAGNTRKGIGIWKTYTAEELVYLENFSDVVSALLFTADGNSLLVGTWDGMLSHWDLHTKSLKRMINVGPGIGCFAASPDGHQLLIGGSGYAAVWSLDSWQETMSLINVSFAEDAMNATSCEVDWSADGNLILTGGDSARVWDARNGQLLQQIEHNVGLSGTHFAENNSAIWVAYLDNTIIKWNLETGEQIQKIVLSYASTADFVAFSPDGRLATASGWDGSMIVDLATSTTLRRLELHDRSIRATFSADGKRVATTAFIRPVRLFSVQNETSIKHIVGKDYGVGVHFFPDYEHIWLGTRLGTTMRIYSRSKQRIVAELADQLNASCIAQSSSTLFVSCDTEYVYQYDMRSWERVATFDTHHKVESIAVNADGAILAVGTSTDTIILFDLDTGSEISKFAKAHRWIKSLEFLPDNRFLFFIDDVSAALLDTQTMKEVRRFSANQENSQGTASAIASHQAFCISADGTQVATNGGSGEERRIYIYETSTGSVMKSFDTDHLSPIRGCAFTPDGHYLITQCDNDSMRVWNVQDGKFVRAVTSLWGTRSGVIQTTADSRHVLIVTYNTDTIWELGLDYLEDVQRALQYLPFDLSEDDRKRFNISDPTPTHALTWQPLI